LGTQDDASAPALAVTRQTGSQTTFAVTPRVALGLGVQKAVQIGRKTSPKSPSEISRQVAVGFAPQTGCGTGMKIDSRKPSGFAMDTTPGTVLGTVPTVVPGMST
jgi:hypothetical protein